MTWRAWLGLDEPDQIQNWTAQRAQREERIHLERLGLAGFGYGWSAGYRTPPFSISEPRRSNDGSAINP